MEAKDLI
jgi:serine/threonine protein kinase